MKILHVIPVSANSEELRFHGSTKDIRCRTEFFKTLGFTVNEIAVARQANKIIKQFNEVDLREYRFIVFDLPGSYPDALRYIKKASPNTLVIFRAHNPEFFHRIDWMFAEKTVRGKLRGLRRAVVGLYRDIRTVYYADYVLPISDWDANYYWQWLGRPKKIVTVPYFLPTKYLSDAAEETKKEKLCVCFTAILLTPLMVDAIKNFTDLVEALGDRCGDWTFGVIGSTTDANIRHSRVHVMGVLDSPFEVIHRARAVAILSDYGRGFKTKIMEAIHARAYVLVTPSLLKRLPREVLPYCISVRKNSAEDFQRALVRSMEPYSSGDPNSAFRARAFEAMSGIFARPSVRTTSVPD